MPVSDPGLYDYAPIIHRPRLTWPDDARVAVWVAPNVEFYELLPPRHPLRRAWPRGQPDVSGYSYRDFGNRVGIWRILELLARCDLFHDDQPFPLKVERGRLISLPYALETNDGTVYGRRLASSRDYESILRAQFDQLCLEGAESGRVMCIPLHPFESGRAHRLGALERALAHITSHPQVWLATARELADWYYAQHYDRMVSFLAERRSAEPAR